MCDFDPETVFDGVLDLQQSRVAKLYDGFGLEVDEMVVLAELV